MAKTIERARVRTQNEVKARIIIINQGVDNINDALKKLGPRNSSKGIDPISVLEDYRFHICQERMALMADLLEAEGVRVDSVESAGHTEPEETCEACS